MSLQVLQELAGVRCTQVGTNSLATSFFLRTLSQVGTAMASAADLIGRHASLHCCLSWLACSSQVECQSLKHIPALPGSPSAGLLHTSKAMHLQHARQLSTLLVLTCTAHVKSASSPALLQMAAGLTLKIAELDENGAVYSLGCMESGFHFSCFCRWQQGLRHNSRTG